MFSFPLFKQNIKSNYKIFIVFLLVLIMYLSIIMSMFDPNTQDKINELMSIMPKSLISAMGMSSSDGTLVSFLGTYYYSFIIVVFPMIFEIIIANKLVAKQVDKGSMAYLLATPNKRSKIIFTQLVYLLISITLLIIFVFLLGLILSNSLFNGRLNVKTFLLMNLGALFLHYAISGISFLSSCLFNDTKNSLAFGAGIPIAFFLIQMIANAGEKFANLKYVTIFTLFNPKEIVSNNSNIILYFSILIIISLTSYILSIFIFNKRDLPL